ncbi:DUF397 domain-containing protein [Streptomyces sp. NPDC001339]|uniref:DUF397 domain-containing protein n=1 Tax=Streptomyces sp. NPDC001339 TaxID=3364563 RepID=UPI003676B1DB
MKLTWTKSSYSDSNERDDCIEVATTATTATTPSTIHIRDSKYLYGPQLHIQPATWTDFVTYAAAER